MARVALFAGSFDPITNGHLDVVDHAVRLADRLVLAVGVHPGKTPLFSAEERLLMLEEICAPVARRRKMAPDRPVSRSPSSETISVPVWSVTLGSAAIRSTRYRDIEASRLRPRMIR